jgi:SET domain-containing protein
MGSKGWGLIAKENIKKGDFIIEYMGEVLDTEMVHWRLEQYSTHGILPNAMSLFLVSYFALPISQHGFIQMGIK